MPGVSQFSRRTLLEAARLLLYVDQAELDYLMIQFSVDNFVTHGPGLSKKNKINELLRFATEAPSHETDDSTNLWDAIVEESVSLANLERDEGFLRALARDGFAIVEEPDDDLFPSKVERRLQRILPEIADLPKAENELHYLLDELGFTTAKGHLNQAIENHARANWAAANGELRKVLENVFDEISVRLEPSVASAKPGGHPRRELLASRNPPFLLQNIGEWSGDGKNFVNGVFKRLHGEGGHPGLSDEEDCTFRLHLVILLTRLLLRRAKQYGVKG